MQNSDYELADRVSRITLDQVGETGITVPMLLDYIGKLSGAILRHQEEGGKAGTHAYDLLAASEIEHVKSTETLIHMVAATVLHRLIAEEGGGRSNISFSPADMDEMHKLYEMDVNRDGMTTEIKLKPRKEHAKSLQLGFDPAPTNPAHAQAGLIPREPHWFARIDNERIHATDKRSAEDAVRNAPEGVAASVENRRCPKVECPAPAHIDNCMAAFCPNKAPK